MELEVPGAEGAGITAQLERLVELEALSEDWRAQAEARDEVRPGEGAAVHWLVWLGGCADKRDVGAVAGVGVGALFGRRSGLRRWSGCFGPSEDDGGARDTSNTQHLHGTRMVASMRYRMRRGERSETEAGRL